jgi:hypothetical protein
MQTMQAAIHLFGMHTSYTSMPHAHGTENEGVTTFTYQIGRKPRPQKSLRGGFVSA